jgi:catechol 2,3-dioxygenase-like lactoylglutathione lyase family enzyme
MSPEPRCLSVAPIMPTTDVARTTAFYSRLGFEMNRHSDDFLMTRRDDIELFFGLNLEHDPKRTAACIYVRVTDSGALYSLWAGIAGVKEPKDQDYRMRDLPVIDPDGNLILFGSPLPES